MAKIASTDKAPRMMAVLEEIVADSKGLIRDWPILSEAREALAKGGTPALARFYTQRANPGDLPVEQFDRLSHVENELFPFFEAQLCETLPKPIDGSQIGASLHDDADTINPGRLRLGGERRGNETGG
jgi:hypothetical protein